MKPNSLLFVSLMSVAIPLIAAENYTINSTKTIPTFEVTPLGFTAITGRFNKTSGDVGIDFKAKTGHVLFTIYSESLNVGWWQEWSQHLSDEGLLNVKNFPIMTFKSDKLIFSGAKVIAAEGEFTMLGITKPLLIQVANFQCGVVGEDRKSGCTGEVTTSVKRSDYGLTKYIPMVSDEVKIKVQVETLK